MPPRKPGFVTPRREHYEESSDSELLSRRLQGSAAKHSLAEAQRETSSEPDASDYQPESSPPPFASSSAARSQQIAVVVNPRISKSSMSL